MSGTVWLRRSAGCAAAVAIAAGAAACGGGDGTASTSAGTPATTSKPAETRTTPQPVDGGRTLLTIDPQARAVLDRVGIGLEPLGEATKTGSRFAFPIAAGAMQVSPLTGTIRHRGGLRLSAAGNHVDVTDLVVRPDKGVVTGQVRGRRVRLFTLRGTRTRITPVSHDVVVLARVMTPDAAAIPVIGPAISMALPDDGMTLGRLRVIAET
jgi:hypothetical protein